MKKSGRLICGSLSVVLCSAVSGCAGQGVRDLFVWNRTSDYKTLDELENNSETSGSNTVASAKTSNTGDQQDSTWRGRMASWSPFGKKEEDTARVADPFLSGEDTTDQIAAVSQSRVIEENASSRKSIDDAMQKSTTETEHLFADLKTKTAAAKTDAAETASESIQTTKSQKPRSPRKAIEDLDAILASEARNRSAEKIAGLQDETASGASETDLSGTDPAGTDPAGAVAMFDSLAQVQSARDRRSSGAKLRSDGFESEVAEKSTGLAFDELIAGADALRKDVKTAGRVIEKSASETAEKPEMAQRSRLKNAERDFFNTLQIAKEVSQTVKRDPFEAAATVAQHISDDSSFEWTKPAAESQDLELTSHRRDVEEKKNVFSTAAFQSVKPDSDSHRSLDIPVSTVSSGTVMAEPSASTVLDDSSDPFFSAGAAPATISDAPVESVANIASQDSTPGFWSSISLRNVILVVGAIIVAFLLFAPNRKEAA